MNCENTLIKSWHVNGFEVRLLGNENYLGYKTFDTRTYQIIDEKSFEEDLQRMKKTPEEMIACLENVRVMIIENNKTSFRKIFDQWSIGDKEIYLFKGDRDLVWDIFSNTTKESTFFSFINSTIPSSRCHPGTVALIEKIKEECLNDIRRAEILMEEFKVVRVLDEEIHNKELKLSEKITEIKKHSPVTDTCLCILIGSINVPALPAIMTMMPALLFTFYTLRKWDNWDAETKTLKHEISQRNLRPPFLIEIEPKITASSVFDERVLVSKFTWSVILVSNGGQSNGTGYGNHAEMYIEGINDGFYNEKSPLLNEAKPVLIGEKFLHKAHNFIKHVGLESGLLSKDDLKYETRSEIWMITSEKVKMMLLNIEKEKNLPKEQRIFNILGEGSIYGEEGHNCFTWARYHLKSIGIDLKGKEMPPSVTGFAAALVTDYTRVPKKHTETPIQRI